MDEGKSEPCGKPIKYKSTGWCGGHYTWATRHGGDPVRPAKALPPPKAPRLYVLNSCDMPVDEFNNFDLDNGQPCGKPAMIRKDTIYKTRWGTQVAQFNLCSTHAQRKDPLTRSYAGFVAGGEIDWQTVIIPMARKIVQEYNDKGVSIGKRGLHYRLFSAQLPGYRNVDSCYNTLCHKTALLRRKGEFPSTADPTRNIYRADFYSDPAHAIESVARHYRLDRTIGQKFCIVVGVEKEGLVALLQSWLDKFGIPIVPTKGFTSPDYEERIVEMVQTERDAGKKSVLLYLGDYDATGVKIDPKFIKDTNCWDKHHRVALTKEMIDQYNLPKAMGKEKDPNRKAFEEENGSNFQVEIDALPPDILRDLLEAAIKRYWNDDAYNAVLEGEKQDREVLSRLNRIDLEHFTRWLAPGAKAYSHV